MFIEVIQNWLKVASTALQKFKKKTFEYMERRMSQVVTTKVGGMFATYLHAGFVIVTFLILSCCEEAELITNWCQIWKMNFIYTGVSERKNSSQKCRSRLCRMIFPSIVTMSCLQK